MSNGCTSNSNWTTTIRKLIHGHGAVNRFTEMENSLAWSPRQDLDLLLIDRFYLIEVFYLINLYNYTFVKVCLGYVQNYDVTGTVHRLTPDYVTSGQYEVDIAGLRYNARVSLRSPTLPTKFRETYGDHYVATRHGGGA